jgi:hypothetical protein
MDHWLTGVAGQPVAPPESNAKPQTQKPSTLSAKRSRFMEMTWAAFLARHNPATTKANPACIRITSTPANTTNVRFMDTVFPSC